jgi:hypothetical protein
MHLDLSSLLNLISTVAIVAALIFAALQVRQGNLKRRDQAAVTMIQTALSENSARILELFGEIPENASATVINQLGSETKRILFEFAIRLEVMGYMVFRRIVELEMVDELAGGAVLAFWSRAKAWAEHAREQAGHAEFMEWCQWLAQRIAERRARLSYEPAHLRHAHWRE